MSKEYVMQLEATIKNLRRDNQLLKEELSKYKAIDNANPSEALECLEKVYSRLPQWDLSRNVDQCNIIKQALLKAQKEHKALEVLEKIIDFDLVEIGSRKVCIYPDNDEGDVVRAISEEEFNALEEVLQ